MAKMLVILIFFAFNLLVYAQVPLPGQLQSGAKFTHFSCSALSEIEATSSNLFKRFRISFKEFGIGDFNEASISVNYEVQNNCLYLAKFHMPSNSNTLQFIESESSNKSVCRPGKALIDKLLVGGIIFKQSRQDHSKFSLQIKNAKHLECENGNLFLEFTRTR